MNQSTSHSSCSQLMPQLSIMSSNSTLTAFMTTYSNHLKRNVYACLGTFHVLAWSWQCDYVRVCVERKGTFFYSRLLYSVILERPISCQKAWVLSPVVQSHRTCNNKFASFFFPQANLTRTETLFFMNWNNEFLKNYYTMLRKKDRYFDKSMVVPITSTKHIF